MGNSVSEIPDEELLRRAVKSCRDVTARKRYKYSRWQAVHHTFALGHWFSRELCIRFGLDPDEQITN